MSQNCCCFCTLLGQFLTCLSFIQKGDAANRHEKYSVNVNGASIDDEFADGAMPQVRHSSSNSASSPSTSLHVQVSCQTEQNVKEDWAATVIQTAFRAFLVVEPFIFMSF